MRLVIVESPYAGNRTLNLAYLKAAMLDCLNKNEAPFASHKLYTDVLDDDIAQERSLGIDAGLAWAMKADASVVYQDLGCSKGMLLGIADARKHVRPVEYRVLSDYVEFARFAGCVHWIACPGEGCGCICVFCTWLNSLQREPNVEVKQF